MRRTWILVVVVGTALVVASSALAKTIEQSGQVLGDTNSSVTLDVKKKKKKLKKVKNFQFENVTAECQGKDSPPIEVAATLPTMKVFDKKQFSANIDGINGPDTDVKVDGTLKKKGKKAVGTLDYSQGKGQERCRTGRVDFRTKKV